MDRLEKQKMDIDPAKVVDRHEDGTWKGSGNPNGPKKGNKRLRTKLLEEKLASSDYDPLQALIETAKDEATPLDIKVRVDMDLMGFLYPKRKPQSDAVEIPLGQTQTISELSEAQSTVLENLCRGDISPDNAKIVCDLIDGKRKALETEEIEKRLSVLEAESNHSKGKK